MNGGDTNLKIESPRRPAGPFNLRPATIFPGVPKENLPKNHQPVAESFTTDNEFSAAPENHPTIAGVEERNELYVVQPATVELLPPAPAAAVEIVRPGEYHPGICDQMLAYFDKPKNREIIDTYTWKSGAVSEKSRYVPNTPPHFSEFARSIGVTTRTLKKWCREHPEFKEAYDQCQEIFEEFLIDNGLVGSYGAIAMKFVAVNRSKMKDKSVQENHTLDMNKVLDKIAAGEVRPGGQMQIESENDY